MTTKTTRDNAASSMDRDACFKTAVDVATPFPSADGPGRTHHPSVELHGEAFLASPFRLEWAAEDWTPNERAEVERGIAQRATSILRAARFAGLLHDHQDVEAEVKVWLESATVPVHVAVWWEETYTKFWFAVVDAVAQERVALVVFDAVPSMTLREMRFIDAGLMRVVRTLVPDEGVALDRFVDALREK